jgi:uncharacterized protein (DUF58 family)
VTGFAPLQHEADGLGAGLPPLMVAADHLAASVSLGVHGRRKSGIGESFWQFRRYRGEDAPARIDWRQSAKSQHLFVREREWEAAQTVWFWRDNGPGMQFSSATVSKLERANLLLLALASLLVRGGERVGLMGAEHRPAASRLALSRIGHGLLDPAAPVLTTPPQMPIARGAQLVWLGDFLSPDAEEQMRRLSRAGAVGHILRIVDPAEEDFPYTGRTRFQMAGSRDDILLGRAERVGDAYRARFRAHGEAIAQAATRLGWTATVHRIDHSPLKALMALHAAMGQSSINQSSIRQS